MIPTKQIVARAGLWCVLAAVLVTGCRWEQKEPAAYGLTWAIAIHGGAGGMPRDTPEEVRASYVASLEDALRIGSKVLAEGGASLDAVEAVVRRLEDDPHFNAGCGSVLNGDGVVEMDASIVDGRTKASGAVAGVRTVRNPISLARRVMTDTRHVLIAGEGAERFARSIGAPTESPEYFITPKIRESWESMRSQGAATPANTSIGAFGTVGCVARDVHGNLAAATSTGGLMNKMPGRIGDSPIHGAGCYADNQSCAVSGTGTGERFIQHNVAFHISARMNYLDEPLKEAVEHLIGKTLDPGVGGVIAVDSSGNIVMRFNTTAMLRAAADSTGRFETAIWE